VSYLLCKMTNGKRDSEVKVSEQKKINSWEVVKKMENESRETDVYHRSYRKM
jgi:hypothetical protein